MALDFTTASLDSRVTFTRTGNTATVTNSSGVIAAINANLPRFDFDPITLTCKGLLIEEARTNLTLGSAAFNDVAYWTPTAASIGATPITAPDNTSTGFKLVESATTAVHLIVPVLTWATTIGQVITRSVYVKAGERFRFEIQADAGPYGAVQRAGFNLQTVTASITTGTGTASITNVGNGWYRCSFTAPAATAISASASGQFRLLDDAGNPSYAGNGTSGLYLWGTQREDGSFATSYIPTVASQVTRTADVAVMTGTNFSDWYNASEGAFVASSVLSRQASAFLTTIFSVTDNTSANAINCFYRTAGSLGLNIITSSVTQFDQTPLGVTSSNTQVNIGVAYKLNNTVSYANATVQTTATTVSIPTVSQLQLGFTPTGNYLNGWVRNLRFYKQRILNAEGQAFSK